MVREKSIAIDVVEFTSVRCGATRTNSRNDRGVQTEQRSEPRFNVIVLFVSNGFFKFNLENKKKKELDIIFNSCYVKCN